MKRTETIIYVPELHYQKYIVPTLNPLEALQLIYDGDATPMGKSQLEESLSPTEHAWVYELNNYGEEIAYKLDTQNQWFEVPIK